MKLLFTAIFVAACLVLPASAAPGEVEPGFNPMVNSSSSDEVTSATMQSDGKILLDGVFTSVGGVARNNIARLNADGSLDEGFNPNANNSVRCFVVQADGKILIGGWFTMIGGVARNYIARLHPDGTLDAGFNPNLNNSVRSTALLADGRILIGGNFTRVGGGVVARNRLVRFHADGTLDESFDPNISDSVRSAVEQADGRIVIGGNFSTVAGVSRNRIARLNADGTLDATFNPSTSDRTYSLALQPDGKVLIGGFFFTVGGATHHHVARLNNDPATQALSVTSMNRIEWLRGGSSPETREVTFEVSTNGGVSYAPWGAGTRITGGWERSGNGANELTAYRGLPASGQVRARARTVSGYYNGSKGLVESIATFSELDVPEIGISGNGVDIAIDNGIPDVADGTDFGAQSIATGPVLQTYTIQNTGTAELVLGPIAITGMNPADFTVTIAPISPVAAGGSTTFQLAFDPSAAGSRWAHLGILTNDFNEYSFQFQVTGRGLSNNPNLANLALSSGTPVSPAFAAEATSYIANVSYDTTSITLTPTAAQGNASITVNGNAVISGSASADLPVKVGTTTLTVLVTAEDGVTTQTYSVVVKRAAFPPGGIVEPGFNLNLSWQDNLYHIESMSLQPGRGFNTAFTDFSVAWGYGVQRWQANGILDSQFNAGFDGFVKATAVQADGKLLVGGHFFYQTVFGQMRQGIVRLHGDGARDEGFDPNVNGNIASIAVQPDGRILIAGGFSMVNGVTRNHIARLYADGHLDMEFDPNAIGVNTIFLQSDNKVIIGGLFTSVGGVTRKGIARLNADGTVDTSFNANTNDTFDGFTHGAGNVGCVAVQADGKVLVGGSFTTKNGVPRNGFARLNEDGSLDADFAILTFVNAGVYNITIQSDGEILIGGAFIATGGGIQRNSFARLHADGTLDAFFDPAPNSAVTATLLQDDGKILIGGAFSAVGGVVRNYFARLDNVPATQTLSVTSANRIEWLRGGSSPEAYQVAFEISTDGGIRYATVGVGTRIAGGWECAGVKLPESGLLRARGYIGVGSLVESVITFSGLLVAEIAVSGNGMNIPAGDESPGAADHTEFGTRLISAGTAVRTFTLHNSGSVDLAIGAITVTGVNATDFAVTNAPSSLLAAGGTSEFQVTFAASSVGVRSAVVSIANHDFDEDPFTFSVQGFGLSGTGDDDGDSVPNRLEFAFGTNPSSGGSGPATTEVANGVITRFGTPTMLAAASPGGSKQALFSRRADWSAAGLGMVVQFSADLSTWQDSAATPTVIAETNGIEAVTVPFPVLGDGLPARFFRVGVTQSP